MSAIVPPGLPPQPPKLLDRVRTAIRLRHFSPRTEEAYVGWARRYILFHRKRHPSEMGEAEVVAFLTHLANGRGVSASTQNQALASGREHDDGVYARAQPRSVGGEESGGPDCADAEGSEAGVRGVPDLG